MNEYPMIAKTLKGLEEVLAGELVALGADNIELQRRAVSFTGDKALMYKANLHLRTALRVLRPIATFKATTPEDVYAAVMNIDWSQWLDTEASFAIDSTIYSDEISNTRFLTYRVKDGIVDWFKAKYDKRPSVKLDHPDILINVHLSHKQCTLSLDSSGESLHKRAYRVDQLEAPISEVLAAGMLLLAGWDGQCDLMDPCCGSGTFLIEAALIALNIPPGLYRSGFGFEKWKDFDQELFDDVYQDDSAERPFNHRIYGSDISRRAIEVAKENISNAGLNKYIDLKQLPVADLAPPNDEPCLIVTNPPYGERINPADISSIYSDLGRSLKHRFPGSTAWVISSSEDLLKQIGLKPAQKIHLLNAALECQYNRYDMFVGKRNEYLQQQT